MLGRPTIFCVDSKARDVIVREALSEELTFELNNEKEVAIPGGKAFRNRKESRPCWGDSESEGMFTELAES